MEAKGYKTDSISVSTPFIRHDPRTIINYLAYNEVADNDSNSWGHVNHKHIYLTTLNNVNFYTFKKYVMFANSLPYTGYGTGFCYYSYGGLYANQLPFLVLSFTKKKKKSRFLTS